MNGIPEAVQRQAEASDEALEQEVQMRQQQGYPQQPNQPPYPGGNGQPQIADLESLGRDTGQQPAPHQAPGGDQVVSRAQYDLLSQRYATLQGKYNAEVPQLHSAVQQMQQELQSLREERQPQPHQQGSAFSRYLSEEEREEYKNQEEALGVSGRAMLGIMEERLSARERALSQQLQQLQQMQEQSLASSHEDKIWTAVDQICPGAKNINLHDSGFRLFLQESDPNNPLGKTFADQAQNAYNGGDVRRLAEIVQEYMDRSGMRGADPTLSQLRPSAVRGAQAPGGGGNGQKPFIQESQIEQFYKAQALGEYRGREEEAQRIERQIEEAERENRILPG